MVMGFSRVWSYTLDSSLRCGKAYVSSKLWFWCNVCHSLFNVCIGKAFTQRGLSCASSGCGHYFLEKGFLNVKYVLKCFLVDTTWRCTWKLTLDKGLTIADIEEIVTNISPKPQSWRYISFSTAERSPKCNSTQEKSICEHCVEIV